MEEAPKNMVGVVSSSNEEPNMVVCSLCSSREAFYARRYSGESFCRECFGESIEKKVRVTIGSRNMFGFSDRIAVAVSGGKDSIGLLHILSRIERDFPQSSVWAITIDEGIEGYRNEAIGITAENCTELGLQQVTLSFKNLYGFTMDEITAKTQKKGLTPCAYCGVLRRRALNLAGKKIRADKIATAHTLDDEIQTFLLNIIHGSPLRIARSFQDFNKESGFLPRVKPLCEILERETALYAYVKGVSFQETPCPYAGEAMRNDVRNTLNRLEERHSGTKYTIFGSMQEIQRAMGEKESQVSFNECEICREPTTGTICQVCQLLKEIRNL